MRTSAGYLFMDYKKSSRSWPEHLSTLEKQGLILSSSDPHYFSLVSFHRLSPYFAVFYLLNDSQFTQNTTFAEIWQLYEFDRGLRLLLSDAIERIEVAFRTTLSESMCNEYGAHWFMQEALFKNAAAHQRFLKKAAEVCQDKRDEELKHYYSRYHNPHLPPSWVLIEKLSFGTCSNLFRSLKFTQDKKKISQLFGYHPTLIASWIDAVRYTRNLCAHHARVWNRWFVTIPILPQPFIEYKNQERRFIAQALIIVTLLNKLLPHNNWKEQLFALFERYPNTPFTQMGFSKDWKEDKFWF